MQDVQAAKAAADAAFRQKQYALAVREYNSAIGVSEEHQLPDLLHVLYSNRSAAKLALRDCQGALVDAQASVAVDPKWLKGWYRSARALQGLGKHDLAVQALQQAVQLQPNNEEVQQLLRQVQQQTSSSFTPIQHQLSAGESPQKPQQQQQQQQQSTQPTEPVNTRQPNIQQQQQQRLPWSQLNKLRCSLHLHLLPQQLVVGNEYIPSADGMNQNLLLLLHGLGDNPAAFTALARRMALPQTASLALSGPLIIPGTNGGRAWFTAYDDDWELIQPRSGETRRIKSLQATVQLLQQQLLPVLLRVGGWRSDQVFMFGFSQGGTVALEMARVCRGEQRLGGVVAISAALLEEQLDGTASSGSSSSSSDRADATEDPGSDALITHGDNDDVIGRTAVNRTVQLLKASACDVQLKTLPGKGHGMISSAEEMRACMAFWGARLKARPADPDLVEVSAKESAAVMQGLV